MNQAPIFIHSLFRSGSTYIFNAFRNASTKYHCFQESLHELSFYAQENPSIFLFDEHELAARLRHPKLDKTYFHELHEIVDVWRGSLSEESIYKNYFAPAGSDIGVGFFTLLASASKERSVFQECRTPGRIAELKHSIGGTHLYLWRNPWDQWWSYKVASFFDSANQIIIHATDPPACVRPLICELGLASYEGVDISGAMEHYSKSPLTSEQSYLVFYMLWCLGLQSGSDHADGMLNIDYLGTNAAYRSDVSETLAGAGIDGVDFSDCQAPSAHYLPEDSEFFVPLENRVHDWLLDGGWQQDQISGLIELRRRFSASAADQELSEPALRQASQAARARSLSRRFETQWAISRKELSLSCSSAEAHAAQAEARAGQAEARAAQAESTSSQVLLQLDEIRMSTSWKVTAPLRLAKDLLTRNSGN